MLIWTSAFESALALIVVSAFRSSGKEDVGKENNKSAIFLSYIFLSAGRNDDQGFRARRGPLFCAPRSSKDCAAI
jgi:hypothetical protein